MIDIFDIKRKEQSMKTNIERLREAVITAVDSMKNREVKRMILKNELNFIERRGMEEYFLVAQELINELKGHEGILLGPGRGWMTGSHVCRALGLTSFIYDCIKPVVTWGDDEFTPMIDIDVDADSYDFVKKKVDEYTQKSGYHFNIYVSQEVTKIKRMLALIEKNGKEAPQLYMWIWHKYYDLFYNGDLDGIPGFGDTIIQKMTKALLPKWKFAAFEGLLNVIGLYSSDVILCDEEEIARYEKRHGLLDVLGRTLFPFGFLYKEDVAWFLNGWIGFSWRQAVQVIKFADKKMWCEAEPLKHFYLKQGMDNGFSESELNSIWDSWFGRDKPFLSMSEVAGDVYISVVLARLKKDYPEEFGKTQTKSSNVIL